MRGGSSTRREAGRSIAALFLKAKRRVIRRGADWRPQVRSAPTTNEVTGFCSLESLLTVDGAWLPTIQ